jgi:hypothetical protein
MKIVYAVEYIEVDFGQRSEGYSLYLDLDKCRTATLKASVGGSYGEVGGYYGPMRPLCCVEVPFDSLDEKLQKELNDKGMTHTEDNWHPKFSGTRHWIK